MSKFHHKTTRIVSVLTLLAFLLTQAGPSYALRSQQARVNSAGEEIAGALIAGSHITRAGETGTPAAGGEVSVKAKSIGEFSDEDFVRIARGDIAEAMSVLREDPRLREDVIINIELALDLIDGIDTAPANKLRKQAQGVLGKLRGAAEPKTKASAAEPANAGGKESLIRIITDAEKQKLAAQMREWIIQSGLVEALNSAGIDFTFLIVSSLGHHGKGLTYMADVDIALKYRYRDGHSSDKKNIRDQYKRILSECGKAE